MSIDTKETTAELLQRFQYADSHRQQYDERALRWYQLYIGWRKDLPPELAGRSNLHIPRTYEEVDTLRARFLKAMFASRPYIDFTPKLAPGFNLQLLQQEEDKAKVAGALVDDQLDGMVTAFYDFITCFLVYPVAVASVGWKYQTRMAKVKQPRLIEPSLRDRVMSMIQGQQATPQMVLEEVMQEVVEYDGNDIQPVDYFDFWADPRGTNIDNCRFVFHREWCTEKELKDKLALLKKAGAGNVYEPEDWEALITSGSHLQDGRSDRLATIGLGSDDSQGYWSDPHKGYLMELLHYWEDDRHAIIVNRNDIVFDGQNPYHRHGKKPFIATSFDPLPGEFYGLSAVQMIEHLQAELNTNRNQRIDNVSFVLNRMWEVRRSAEIGDEQLVSRPGGIIEVDKLGQDIKPVETPDVTSSAYNEENIIKQDMENVLAVPAVVRGADPNGKQTATEVVTKNSSAGFRFDTKVMLYESLCLKRLAYLMDCNNQQFIDDTRLVQIFGELGAEWKEVNPYELIGERDYTPAGSSVDSMANKEIRRQQLNELLQIASSNPLVSQSVNIPELIKMLFQSYDIRAVDKLLLSPEEIALRQQQEAMQLAQQQGMLVLQPQQQGQMGPEQAAMVQKALGGMPQ